MFNKTKAVKDLRSQAKKMQNALSEIVEIGEGGNGKVRIAIDGNQEVQRVEIDQDAFEDKGRLEDAVKEAMNKGVKKIQKQMAVKMREMGGLDALKNLGM